MFYSIAKSRPIELSVPLLSQSLGRDILEHELNHSSWPESSAADNHITKVISGGVREFLTRDSRSDIGARLSSLCPGWSINCS